MPTRNLSFQSSLGGSDLVKIRDLSHPEENVFDEEFHADMDMKDWNSWMQNEAPTQLDSPMIDRRLSIASTVSWLEGTSCSHIEKQNQQGFVTTPSFMSNNEFSFEDALLDFDDVPANSYAMPLLASNSNSLSSSSDSIRASQDMSRRGHPMSSLTAAEERCLTDIAMPYHILNKSKVSTSTSNSNSSSTSSSLKSTTHQNKRKSLSPSYSPEPEPSPPTTTTTRKTRTNKKQRKSANLAGLDDAESRNALCQSRKTGHNMIEKRYRTNLNEKIDCLRQSVPAFPRRSSTTDSGAEAEEGVEGEEGEDGEEGDRESKIGRQKYGKAAILTRALEYIHHLENTTQRLGGEVEGLRERVGAFEKLAMGGSLNLGGGMGLGLVAGGLLGGGGKCETLESIREDFKQVGPKYRDTSVAAPAVARRRNSRLVKGVA